MNILRVKDENGNWIDIPAIKGDKGDKGESGDITPELEALRDQVTESADRAEEAAQKLESGLVLQKGDAADSIVHGITPEQNADGTWKANQSTATADTAVALGKYNAVSGKNSMAVNYKNRVTAERAFAANEDNTVAGKRSAAFGWKNTVESENSFGCGYANTLSGRNSFGTGYSNKVMALNGFAAGQSNTVDVDAQNGFGCGSENTLSGKNTFSTGNLNTVKALNGFAAGYSNTLEETAVDGAAIGELNTVAGKAAFSAGGYNELNGAGSFAAGSFNKIDMQYAAALGNRNEVQSASGMAFGEVLQVTERTQVAVGRANAPVEGALFMVGNGTYDVLEDGAPATNIKRSNAFEVHKDHIVVGGVALPAEMLKYHCDGYAEIAADNDAMVDRCIAWFNALGDQHFGRYVLNKGGQIHFIEIYRTNASWGVIKSTIYHTSDGADVSYGSVVEGKFTGFNHICWQNHNHDDRYYTEEEIDEKFSNVSGGGSAGMLREFESDVTAGAEIADEKTLEWQGNKSKFYTVTVKALETGDTCYYTFTVDYKALSATIGRLKLYQSFPTKKCYLEVFVDSEKHVHFEIGEDSDSNVFLYKVCGYY